MAKKKTLPNLAEVKITGPVKPEAQPFIMNREVDETGVSGIGPVADGIVFPSGTCVVEWRGPNPCVQVWHSFEAFQRVHIDSHPDNKTKIIWHKVTDT